MSSPSLTGGSLYGILDLGILVFARNFRIYSREFQIFARFSGASPTAFYKGYDLNPWGPKTPLKFEVFLVLGILEFPTMSSPSPFGGSLYGILDLGILVLGILEFLGCLGVRRYFLSQGILDLRILDLRILILRILFKEFKFKNFLLCHPPA